MRVVGILLGCLIAVSCATADGKFPFRMEPVATFDRPWAMTFLPDGRLLVTERAGALYIVTQDGKKSAPVDGVPKVVFGGQGGLGDVILHPDFPTNGWLYLSYSESGDGNKQGAAVMRAKLREAADGTATLQNQSVIWRQNPKVTGKGHYGHRMAFSSDGYLFISSGERQKFDPSQDMSGNLGKIVRLRDDGSIPDDNPFADQGEVAAEVWSLGHRNPLGLAFDTDGRLWNTEMGPKHGDELNLVIRGKNYGYPLVSNGDHYSGKKIPDHDTRPDLEAPKAYWVPAISPAGLMIYNGSMFPQWQGNAFIGGMSAAAWVRVEINGDEAREVERYKLGKRIREQEEGPAGAIWLLEDGKDGRLLRLTPH